MGQICWICSSLKHFSKWHSGNYLLSQEEMDWNQLVGGRTASAEDVRLGTVKSFSTVKLQLDVVCFLFVCLLVFPLTFHKRWGIKLQNVLGWKMQENTFEVWLKCCVWKNVWFGEIHWLQRFLRAGLVGSKPWCSSLVETLAPFAALF